MKKICRICMIGILISIVCFGQSVKADSLERLKDSEDYNTVLSMSESIIKYTNADPVSSTGGRPVTYEDIDFEHAVKEYLNAPLIKDEIIKYTDAMEVLQESIYVDYTCSCR